MDIKKIIRELIGNESFLKLRRFYYTPLQLYYQFSLSSKIADVRKKPIIKVAFVIHELASWKTEELFVTMLKHVRFEPLLLLSPSNDDKNAINTIRDYMDKKKYSYNILDSDKTICEQFNPDIIFYQKPYSSILPEKLFFSKNLKSLFCFVYYSFRNKTLRESQNAPIHSFIWQEYIENNSVYEELREIMDNHARNIYVTGLPVMDQLVRSKESYNNPWKKNGKDKKKIIYAPHHSVYSELGEWSTFLKYCDFMLEMAIKYKDLVQFAFKPHPLLYPKLCNIWGKEKTDNYYKQWSVMDNTQIETGPYMDLFKHSDAMIHDCGSFMIEYLYTQNPVLYLYLDKHHNDIINKQSIEALEAHYEGWNKDDIELFIQNVIEGKDDMVEKRKLYYNKYLLPPNNKTACENIINAILGN